MRKWGVGNSLAFLLPGGQTRQDWSGASVARTHRKVSFCDHLGQSFERAVTVVYRCRIGTRKHIKGRRDWREGEGSER